ncbi:A nuclease family of the HNH/ENDO VII superfamily with conserved AHH [Vibrio xiamenensis]|uniref:A nuclease family of the HNH/ENDO VII superfamily with conserved AHH n=1 Tax=Vibrio xiamenensis TaxID=861298 RepID=A0A1G8F3L4_9VIBR|nr:PAAR-like domain-containing protein [Vibrio xiamenensis]SDH76730.1 A nuclease family of the HNH/ENDO VII superfamily with conserved AHH [Vibrio xiamenensis]
MGVTVNANGLSIVHKGSGGEANATLPDVCLTQCGPPVVPIPYGNNAKSADLVDGTTTITMDGGNSVAIKGSKFSKSTGDSGGDKKGVASGTIEGEAEFISASPTVKFEGAGVCRLSDQMTMNKANTMCLGGAQNPSVTVTEDAEGTYTVDLEVTYEDGEGFQATYILVDSTGAKYEGQLDEKGKASISGVSAGVFTVEFGEDQRDFKPLEKHINKNPLYKKKFDPAELLEEAKMGKIGFWEATKNQAATTGNWLWGVLIGDFNKDPTSGQIMLNTILGVIPGVDQVLDARDIGANLFFLADEKNRSDPAAWVDLALSAIGAIPEIGSVMKGVGRAIKSKKSRDDIFASVRAMGKGNVEKFLTEIDWSYLKYEILQIVAESIASFGQVLDQLANYADMFGYEVYATEILTFKSKMEDIEKAAEKNIPDALLYFKDLLDQGLKRGHSRSTKGSHEAKSSAESGSHTETVSEDKKNKKADKCWLCEKNIGKKKQKKPSATYCEHNGYKGKHYSEKDKHFGFTKRGNSDNGHYPWQLLKAHNKRKNASPMRHPLYARCYDKTEDGKGYVRPQQIWSKAEALKEFDALKKLDLSDKDDMPGVEKNLQAHHIITVDEMKNNKFLFNKLPYLGYDLNDWHNIVVLPGIPELACFYEMPLHSGSHPTPYTVKVKNELNKLSIRIKESEFCDEPALKAAEKICDELIDISDSIHQLIMDFDEDGALNNNFHDIYHTGNKGCCNQLNHSTISEGLLACRHRVASLENPNLHHDFRTTIKRKTQRIPYSGKKSSPIGY